MDSLGPWLVVAGAGALHGLNPAGGWAWAAVWGLRAHGSARWRGVCRALAPMALGQLASMALVTSALTWGWGLERRVWQSVGVALLAAVVVLVGMAHLAGHRARVWAPAGFAGLVLWSFTMATAHGAGLLLVPALATLCWGDVSASHSLVPGPWRQTLGAVAAVGMVLVHTAAMLAVSGAAALAACRGWDVGARWWWRFLRRPAH